MFSHTGILGKNRVSELRGNPVGGFCEGENRTSEPQEAAPLRVVSRDL